MIEQSRDEYLEISNLIREASTSIFQYTSLLVTFSAAVFAFIIDGASDNGTFSLDAKDQMMMIIVVIITLYIQISINYKCESHNRLTGYRSLIAAEIFTKPIGDDDLKKHLLSTSFSVCLDYLNKAFAQREFDFKIVEYQYFNPESKGLLYGLTEKYSIDEFVAKSFPKKVRVILKGKYIVRQASDDDVWRYGRAFWSLFLSMVGKRKKKGTWGFPDTINRMITFIVAVELAIFLYFFLPNFRELSEEIVSAGCGNILSALWEGADNLGVLFLFIISLFLLRSVSIEWQNLMIGSKRVSVYFVQFMPFRMIYLRAMYGDEIRPYYAGDGCRRDEMV